MSSVRKEVHHTKTYRTESVANSFQDHRLLVEFVSPWDGCISVARSIGRLGKVRCGLGCRGSGEHGNKLHERFMIGLELFHLQLDELYGYVKPAGHEIWVWTIVDAKTKLMPVLQIGPRTQAMAYGVVHELKSRSKNRLRADL